VTWQPGQDKISGLLDAGELEQVTVDRRIAQLLLDDAGRHLATAATALSSGDLSGAYQLAYDALRKSAGLLALQGLRATSRGGHVAVQESVMAQFGSTVRAVRSFGSIAWIAWESILATRARPASVRGGRPTESLADASYEA
jgi:hypothetical protein